MSFFRSYRQFLETFKEFPPRMKAASFTADQVLAKMDFTRESGSCRKG
jgi:hypothetical protein